MYIEKLVSLYVDVPDWKPSIAPDDFIVAIGIKQSNSVYHVAEARAASSPKDKRIKRNYLKCYKSDLITALQRDTEQKLIPITWYSRNKK